MHQVRARIRPDLALQSQDPDQATTGDCTTFALAYASLAARDHIPTHLVTGLRLEGNRLVRHRWAISWTGTRWLALDVAFGAVPADSNLLPLAIHDGDNTGLIAGEAALGQVTGAEWR